jgi:hypothetical protein
MPYYVRVLSTSANCVSYSRLQSALENEQSAATLSIEAGEPEDWTQIILAHANGDEIASIERDVLNGGSLAAEELEEFAEEVVDCKPTTAANWLVEYFPRVKCIYAFQVLSGAYQTNGWEIFDVVKSCIWSAAPSIIQADNEGFSNEDGYHILWQFNDSVDGDWWMAVLRDGQWQRFQMDLGNHKHRESFFAGEIPSDATLS